MDRLTGKRHDIAKALLGLGGDYLITEEVIDAAEAIYETLHENKRGILLAGPVGTGKTELMRRFKRLLRGSKYYFAIESTVNISLLYQSIGTEALIDFYPAKDYNNRWYNRMYDDLGSESPVNHYGTKMDVMFEMMNELYETWQMGARYHFTTNLDADGLSNRYGERAVDRLREMTKFIPLEGQSFRG